MYEYLVKSYSYICGASLELYFWGKYPQDWCHLRFVLIRQKFRQDGAKVVLFKSPSRNESASSNIKGSVWSDC